MTFTSTTDKKIEYRKEIDGLRAVAVIPVILFHAGFSFVSGGYVGVDIFFVISGYLITSILVAEISNNRFTFSNFYERRARRILPALFFVIICCIPFAWVFMTPEQYKDFSQALIAIPSFSSNILFWLKEDYFAPSAEENPLLHTWSLAVEEQYYIFFPILLIALWRKGERTVFFAIIGLSCVSLLAAEFGSKAFPSASFYFLTTRAWELGAGAICALIMSRHKPAHNSAFSGVGLGMVLLSIFLYDSSTPFPSLFALAPVMGTSLIIIYSSKDNFTGKILSTRPMVWIGLISFSAYLWHQPLMAFARIALPSHPSNYVMALLSISSIALAYITWRYIEQPFRSNKLGLLPKRSVVFSVSSFMIFVIIGFGLAGHVGQGLPSRFDLTAAQQSYLETATSSPVRDRCHANKSNIIPPNQACQLSTGSKGGVAVFGDSHAVELAYALSEAVKGNSIVRQYSFSGCKPSYGLSDTSPCTKWTNDSINHIKADDSITDVVVTYRISLALWGDHKGLYPELPKYKSDAERLKVVNSLTSMVRALENAGKNVIYVDQSPELPRDIHRDIYFSKNELDHIIGAKLSWWNLRTNYFEDIFMVPPDIKRVRPSELLCDSEYCYAGRNGEAYYFDDNHLSVHGAKVIAKEIASALSFL